MALRIERLPNVEQPRALVGSGVEKTVNVPVKITGETDGPVTVKQKVKGYYKSVIALVGSLGASLVAIAPMVPDPFNKYAAGGVLILTVFGVFLKKNEDWVNSL